MINNDQDKACLKCDNKSGQQFTCNGCQQSFCWLHVTDHEKDIFQQMDVLSKDHNLLQDDWNDESHYNRLLEQINQWEKESISKIQEKAEAARVDLRLFYEESKSRLQASVRRISEEILTSQKLNNFSEIEINQWTQELKNIQQQAQTSFNIQIDQDEEIPSIALIKIKQKTKRPLEQNEETSKRLRNEISDDVGCNNERFDKVFGEAILSKENLVATNNTDSRSSISGANSYSIGRHSLHFKIEQVYKTGQCCF